jgi:hypothetical protein
MKIKPFWEWKPLWLILCLAGIGGGSASISVNPADPPLDRIAFMIGGLIGGALVGLVFGVVFSRLNRKKPRR